MFSTRSSDVFALPKLVLLWALLAALTTLVVVAVVSEEPRQRFGLIGVVDGPLAAFVALLLAALAMSTDRRQSVFGEVLQHQGVLTTLLYVGFFYVARAVVRDVVRLRMLLGAVAIGATLVSGYALVQALGLDPVWNGWLPSGRVFSTIGQANALAGYLVLAMPATAAVALTSPRIVRLVALGAVGIMAGALVLTYSRGGYLGLTLAATVFAVGTRDRFGSRGRAILAWAGATVVGAALFVAVVPAARSAVVERWSETSRVSALDHDASVHEHLDLWRVAVDIIGRHPLLGTGPDTFPDQFAAHAPAVLPVATASYFERFRVESPHNELLAVAAGAGIPAALAYLALLAGLARTLWRRATRTANARRRVILVAVVAAGAGHVVTDSFMTAELTGSWLFWTIAGGALGVAAIGAESPDDIDTEVRPPALA